MLKSILVLSLMVRCDRIQAGIRAKVKSVIILIALNNKARAMTTWSEMQVPAWLYLFQK
jgi:hypothetical protein